MCAAHIAHQLAKAIGSSTAAAAAAAAAADDDHRMVMAAPARGCRLPQCTRAYTVQGMQQGHGASWQVSSCSRPPCGDEPAAVARADERAVPTQPAALSQQLLRAPLGAVRHALRALRPASHRKCLLQRGLAAQGAGTFEGLLNKQAQRPCMPTHAGPRWPRPSHAAGRTLKGSGISRSVSHQAPAGRRQSRSSWRQRTAQKPAAPRAASSSEGSPKRVAL